MRYPGPTRQDITLRLLTGSLAIAVFSIGFSFAHGKVGRSQHIFKPTITANANLRASPASQPTAVLRLIDGRTNRPIVGQAVVIIEPTDCPSGQDCRANDRPTFVADAHGSVSIPIDLIKAKPKMAVAGYKTDTYFTFLRSDRPNELSLYNPPAGAKTIYDVEREAIPVVLTPL